MSTKNPDNNFKNKRSYMDRFCEIYNILIALLTALLLRNVNSTAI